MIDISKAAQRIHDRDTSHGKPGAVRATTEILAECWDDCARIVAPMSREIDNPNPYRLALELAPAGPSAPDPQPEPNPRYAGWHDVDVTDEMRDAIEGKSNPERDDRQQHRFVTSTDDPELIAMQIIVQALEGLEPRTQERIIRYVSERMA